jgi:hypothetical protein
MKKYDKFYNYRIFSFLCRLEYKVVQKKRCYIEGMSDRSFKNNYDLACKNAELNKRLFYKHET